MKAPAFDAVLDFPLGPDRPRAPGRGRLPRRRRRRPVHGLRRRRPEGRALRPRPGRRVPSTSGGGTRSRSGRTPARSSAAAAASTRARRPPEELKPSKRKALLTRLALGEKDMVLALAELGGPQGIEGGGPGRSSAACRGPGSRSWPGRSRRRTRSASSSSPRSAPRLPGQPGFPQGPDRLVPDPVPQEAPRPAGRSAREDRERGSTPRGRSSSWPCGCWPRRAGPSRKAASCGCPISASPSRPPTRRPWPPSRTWSSSGELGSVTLDDLRARFGLTPGKLQTLLGVLAERKRIVEGIDGFILHSKWLDEIVRKIRGVGQARADRRRLQGHDRPLPQIQHPPAGALGQHGRDPKERLRPRHPVVTPVQSSSRCCRQDEGSMGVTRRKGSVRDIL